MTFIKVIWGIIAIFWLLIIGLNLSDVGSVKSAVQALQLYDEASVGILRIIAITLLINLADESTNTLSEQVQQHAKKLTEQSKRIADILSRLEQRFEDSNIINTFETEIDNEIEQENTFSSPELEVPSHPADSFLCPKCNAPMKIRTATKGELKGKQFYVCSNYPDCQEISPV